MLNKLSSDKKRLIIIIAAVFVCLALIATATVYILKSVSDNNGSKTTISAKESADAVKNQAIQAVKNNDKTKAKELWADAKSKYQALDDTDNIVNANAQLCMLGETQLCNAGAD